MLHTNRASILYVILFRETLTVDTLSPKFDMEKSSASLLTLKFKIVMIMIMTMIRVRRTFTMLDHHPTYLSLNITTNVLRPLGNSPAGKAYLA